MGLLKYTGIIVILAALVIWLAPIPVHADGNVYYVAKTGDDSNDGSPDSPWLTIQHAASSMVAGDSVLVKAGVYNETILAEASGSGSDYITYKNYEDDTVIVDGEGQGSTAVFNLYAQNHIIVDGFTIRNAGMDGIYMGTYRAGGTGNYIIRNCTIHDTQTSGIVVNSSWTTPIQNKISNVTIDNCQIYNTNINGDQEAISLVGVDNFEIKNNTVHDVLGHDHYANDKEGIDAKVGCTNGSIHDNEVYNAKIGIYLDGYGANYSNIDIYNNRVHNTYDVGIGVRSETAGRATATGIDIYNNLIYNNSYGFDTQTNGALTLSFSLVNNTFYNNGTAFSIKLFPNGVTYSSCLIRNNIIQSTGGNCHLLDCASYPTGITIDHNLFYDPSGYSSANKYGTDYIRANPQLVDPPNDFNIPATSPAKDAGSPDSAPGTDFAGTSRTENSSFDIGAYESIDSIPLPTPTPLITPEQTSTYLPATPTPTITSSPTDPESSPTPIFTTTPPQASNPAPSYTQAQETQVDSANLSGLGWVLLAVATVLFLPLTVAGVRFVFSGLRGSQARRIHNKEAYYVAIGLIVWIGLLYLIVFQILAVVQ
jgi:hypothetical protein